MRVHLGFTPDEQSGWEILKGLIGLSNQAKEVHFKYALRGL